MWKMWINRVDKKNNATSKKQRNTYETIKVRKKPPQAYNTRFFHFLTNGLMPIRKSNMQKETNIQ